MPPRAAPTPALIIVAAYIAFASGTAHAEGLLSPCDRCNVLVGVGTTFRFFAWTDGLVVPVTLELDQSRWELGAYRFASGQHFAESGYPESVYAAQPYWGLTAMRRWQILHRSPFRLYAGFGAAYRSKLDYLDPTRWDFAFVIAARFDLGPHGRVLELGVRHWSDAWIKLPNRGENILALSVGF
jgi:hypothetical protein